MKFKQKGFTLIELIIVIAIIALLAAATFVAVNPAKRIGDANNAQRWSDVTAIADAWSTYVADNTGTLATTSYFQDGVTYEILVYGDTTGVAGSASCTATTGVSSVVRLDNLVDSGYIGTLPYDPGTSSGSYTDYYLYTNTTTGQLIVGACESYDSATIEVIR
ncbi:MAG: prepilin-type N-terminal cleavage/methylation domain-containing protein [Candidatus Komeilibacteria bacterium]|jgi:prepilin-type N-terminal cleavage/methylation domain-containing protein|nr:prepilin-type N-terminal cleavage/methylation domain-containing protein [Candidatus Komeilibacteria bacterium]MBT4447579.1 prepilin-type N-terminal cleavage/methylation domain-containing protein [Candidatus Komeilibacteria bacterium]